MKKKPSKPVSSTRKPQKTTSSKNHPEEKPPVEKEVALREKEDQFQESLDFPVVAIGASAGGLEAIEDFIKNLPEDSGLGLVIIQHLSPDYKSLMGELLARHTKIPIQKVEDGVLIRPNNIYLIPPKKNMTMFRGRLYLTDTDPHLGLNLPIDIFFRSLAQDQGKLAIGVVLSGTGSDGALGIRAIKEAGGMVMVQDEKTAKFDGMPKNSIATGMVDFILPPYQMPEAIIKYVQHPLIFKAEQKREDLSEKNALLKILKIIRDRIGIDFTYYKPNTILRRLEKRLGINQIEDFDSYLTYLEHAPNEAYILYKDLLIGVTQFFRDKEAWDLLKKEIIPQLMAGKREGDSVRVWVAGCSTGEEAYSLAILFAEYMEEKGDRYDVKIFATDLDKEFIELASVGSYPESIITDVSPERLDKYFIQKGNQYLVKEEIRRMVIYAKQNIIQDPPFSKIDLISCRNMLIYLNQEMQRKIISMFYYALSPGGVLFLGSSESLGEMADGFAVMNSKWKLFRHKTGYKPPIVNNYMMPLAKNSQKSIKKDNFNYLTHESPGISEGVLGDLLNLVMPPSVILNENHLILHIFGDVSPYMKMPSGRASLNILKMLPKELSVVISSMFHRVIHEGKEVVYRDILLKDKKTRLHLSGKPLDDSHSKKRLMLLTFEPVSSKKPSVKRKKDTSFDLNQDLNERYLELEKELQFTKENLQATIEELETSNEELQSTNEELVASNEELQSTNEELQSVNEELYTVNSEYQKKIEELTMLNNDMNNLLNNTNTGILYLDNKLNIRKFTTQVSQVINILDTDVGRPIHHISLSITYPGFFEDIEYVRDTLKPKEHEFLNIHGRWNLIRITPYRTQDNAIEGIAVLITDISRLKESEKRYQDLFQFMIQGVVYQNHKGEIISANPAAERILGLSLDQMMGKKSIDKAWRALTPDGQDLSGEMHPAMVALRTGKPVYQFIMAIYNPKKKRHTWIKVNSIPQFLPGQRKPFEVFSTFEDISQEREQNRMIQQQDDLFYRILENSPLGQLVLNKEGRITYVNPRFEAIMGLKERTIKTRKYNAQSWKITDASGAPIPDEKLPFQLILLEQKPIRNYGMIIQGKKGKKIPISITAAPLLDSNGEVDGGVFSIEDIPEENLKLTNSWKSY